MKNTEYVDIARKTEILDFTNKYESQLESEWKNINWDICKKHTFQLQKEMFQAVKDSQNYKKARRYEDLLIKSKSALLYSIKEVTQNNKNIQNTKIKKIGTLTDAIRMALFYKIKGIKINQMKIIPPGKTSKNKTKQRQINLPTLIDKIVQTLIKHALEPRFEAIFEASSYGFRPLRNKTHAIEQIRQSTKFMSRPWIFKGNFKSCLDTLDHDWIIKQLGNFPAKKIITTWLKAGYLHNNIYPETNNNTKEEEIITPLLVNIALNGLEKALNVTYKKKKGNFTPFYSKYIVVRYADDYVVLCRKKEDAEKVPQLLEPYLTNRGLTLNSDETFITNLYAGFDFLEFNIRAYKTQTVNKIITQPSNNTLKEFKNKMKKIFTENRNDLNKVIKMANRHIKQTTNYWKQTNAQHTFNKADEYTWTLTRRFLNRRHPNKSWKWIKNKYFKEDYQAIHQDKYILTNPDSPETQLQKMAWTPIQYAKLIKYDCTPYNKEYKEYIQKEWGITPIQSLYK